MQKVKSPMSTAVSRGSAKPLMAPSVRDIRKFLKRNPQGINPYDLLQLALEFLVNVELSKESGAVLVSEILEGFEAVAMVGSSEMPPRNLLKKIVELKILQDPSQWRDSFAYQQWRRRLSEGFHDA